MSNIKVKDYISSAFSNEQAMELRNEIQKYLSEDKITLDFEDISQYTTLFFNFSTGYFIKKLGKDKYDKQFEIINLSELGESTYNHSYNNSLRDVKDEEIKNAILSILQNIDEE